MTFMRTSTAGSCSAAVFWLYGMSSSRIGKALLRVIPRERRDSLAPRHFDRVELCEASARVELAGVGECLHLWRGLWVFVPICGGENDFLPCRHQPCPRFLRNA